MPSKNRVKLFVVDSYYHIYNRGVNKRTIFKDDEDYRVFLNLLKRYLSAEPQKDSKGRAYVSLHNDIELLAFCLMPNHFHMCIYLHNAAAATQLLRAVCTSYSTYFNKKYKRVGPLFQGTYKASIVATEPYALHVSRYIHLNPKAYKKWQYSSYDYYLGNKTASWINPARLLEMFDSKEEYINFVDDYLDHKKQLDEIKWMLADG